MLPFLSGGNPWKNASPDVKEVGIQSSGSTVSVGVVRLYRSGILGPVGRRREEPRAVPFGLVGLTGLAPWGRGLQPWKSSALDNRKVDDV